MMVEPKLLGLVVDSWPSAIPSALHSERPPGQISTGTPFKQPDTLDPNPNQGFRV